MRYEEFAPGPAAAPLVDRYWRFGLDEGDPPQLDHIIVPDGLISVSVVRLPNGHLLGFVAGPTERAHVVPVHQGLQYGGVRFAAGGGLAVPGHTPADLVGRTLQNDELDPAFHTLITSILPAIFDANPAARLDAAMAQWPRAEADPAVHAAAARLMTSDRAARVDTLAAEAGLSERQLRRRFTAAVGLPPKAFARVRRLRAACILAIAEQARLADLSGAAGYADQAHLCRETLDAFGQSPRKVAAYLRRIRHDWAA